MTNHSPETLNASSKLMYQTAQDRGITCTLFGDNETIRMETDKGVWHTRGSRTSFQSSVGHTIARLKHLTKAVLQHANLPTAAFVEVRSNQDLSKLSALTYPIVMKPIAGQHGKQVVVGISDLAEAEQHFKQYNQPVLFEEMLQGTEYRVVCVNYTFVAAAYRKPAFVTGDGKSSIQELIDQKNQHPWRGKGHTSPLTEIVADEKVIANLAEKNLTLNSILDPNQEVFLRKTNNLSTGGEPHEVTDQVHPDNKKVFEQIARACDLSILGIDFMCQDISRPVSDQTGYGVIEVNASPGLRMHHYPIQGQPQDVAGRILDYCQEQL